MHKAVKNLTDTGVNIKSGSNTEVYLISEILLNQVWQLKQLWLSLREIVSAVESGVVTSRILQEVQSFIMAFIYGCSVDLPRRKARQVSTRDLGGDFPVS